MAEETAAWAAILRVHAALVPLFDRELQEAHQLPLSWYDVLLELSSAPGRRLTMGELGQRAVLSRTRVSRVVAELVQDGLVAREPHPEDGRSAHAVITSRGRARLRAAAPTYLAAVRRHFSAHLRARDRATIVTALGRVLAAERDGSA